MRTIAIINQKGGVGKTTTAVNLSAALADAGKRVWLIDLDPQAHASLHLGFGMQEEYLSTYDVLTDNVSLDEVRHQVEDNLWLSPSHIDLAAAEMELAGAVGREIILRDRMKEVTEEFDYVIFDCPPSLGVLTLNALTTANEVVGDVELFFEQQRQTDNSIWSNSTSFDTKIRRNIRLAEAPSYGQSIFQYSGESNGAQDYRSLAEEVLAQTEPMADDFFEAEDEYGYSTSVG